MLSGANLFWRSGARHGFMDTADRGPVGPEVQADTGGGGARGCELVLGGHVARADIRVMRGFGQFGLAVLRCFQEERNAVPGLPRSNIDRSVCNRG